MNDASGTASRLDTLLDRTIVPGYTSLGIALRRRHWPADPAPDALRGKTAVVTGANSGIGLAVAEGLAALGARVVLAVRNPGRGEEARRRIRAAHPDADVVLTECDISDFAAVDACARRLADQLSSLDILVHNAGVLPPERTESADGHELTLATHILGPLRLTDHLVPLLAATEDGRVILMSSGGMYTQRLPVDDLEYRHGDYRGATAYARTKRLQVAFTPVMAERYAAKAITVHAMHPGWVNTPGIADALPGFHRLLRPLLRTPAEGADTALWLAATRPTPPTGQFWHDRHPRPTHYLSRTHYTSGQLWRLWLDCARAAGVSTD
ncbi:SDR family NAD(P)-dependent oxidoreductase [Nocardia bovistercoris]|uniref:SDR family NAD(P)-dependent oxidoreductase n=1 Tax=Nocardia bovistercoris TaxID=2785916 RepID=A0A931I8E8_9NOCA|nr:SDR family NAD(P)-dependent oxidoreductase [Nocardia bovistercoris]MBH0775652.1 SDR family NAD(P)-dependent oxidoreductase [Nocardia bovistercoris]